MVADSSKVGRSSLARLCPLGDVQKLVVDSGIAAPWPERIAAAGVALTIAECDADEQTAARE